ncbi:hypothetical protein XENOCAPTIV_022184 [Xenoophorus captivus]|uniref:PLAT domain-containing protein n=1 Tax=Xenoophorus captivus TaxID=1517983 RepID=A0ABV0RBB4_9TELE
MKETIGHQSGAPLIMLVIKRSCLDSNAIQVTINLTHNSLFPPDYPSSGGKCWGFLLWAWVSGTDQNFYLFVCEVKSETTLSRTTTAKKVKIMLGNSTADDWFQVITGVSGTNNN